MIDWTSTAAMVTAWGTLLAAVAWPVALLVVMLSFRAEIKAIATRLPSLMERVQLLRVGGVEAMLKDVASVAREDSGTVSAVEKVAAEQIRESAPFLPRLELSLKMDALAREYDRIRRTMQSGHERTRAMTGVLVQMRALGPSVASHIQTFKSSGSPGSRLAAIAIMQMVPSMIDLDWLVQRFEQEQPFLFYHAALAIQNAANEWESARRDEVYAAARRALSIVEAFKPTPDAETLAVLNAIAH